MGASLRFWWSGGGHRRRQAHEQCRQCRRPAPLARRRRIHAPRAGGMGVSLRFWWGGGGHRRRQAHEQCRQCRRPARWLGIDAPMPHEQGAWALLCVSGGAVEGVDGGRPTSSAGSAGGQRRWLGSTHPCPTSRGHGRFFAFLVGREREQTAAGPRAGACRLRRFLGDGEVGGWKRWSCTCGGGGGMMMGWNCARGATLPCPNGARGAAGGRRRRCLPRWGKGAGCRHCRHCRHCRPGIILPPPIRARGPALYASMPSMLPALPLKAMLYHLSP